MWQKLFWNEVLMHQMIHSECEGICKASMVFQTPALCPKWRYLRIFPGYCAVLPELSQQSPISNPFSGVLLVVDLGFGFTQSTEAEKQAVWSFDCYFTWFHWTNCHVVREPFLHWFWEIIPFFIALLHFLLHVFPSKDKQLLFALWQTKQNHKGYIDKDRPPRYRRPQRVCEL